jgi:hypothetical protein
MHDLKQLIIDRITSGLARKSITKCSEWAERYRKLEIETEDGSKQIRPWSFKRHPWLREMHDSDAEMNIGQKAAQMGYTETVLNRTLYTLDIKNRDCLYILPSWKPDASDFSAARFNPAIEMSPHLAEGFSDVSNIGHKRWGTANLYIRGAKSRSQLKSIPVSQIVIDEKDEMPPKHVPLAFERQSGQAHREVWQISTPTYPEYGINGDFIHSSQNHFFFRCPSCSRMTELIFPDCLVVTAELITDPALKESHIICKECQAILPHETKEFWLADNEWVETYLQRDVKGWYVNQLYSPVLEPYKIAQSVIKARLDPAEDQELHNSKMGIPHIVKGAGVTDLEITARIKPYRMMSSYDSNRVVTMGIDVGWPVCHVEIDEWMLPSSGAVDINLASTPRVIFLDEILGFEELRRIFFAFKVHFAVIDSQPERRMALEFANSIYGKVRCCSYEMGIEGKSIHLLDNEPRLKVDRTSWLDLSLGRFKRENGIYLPSDMPEDYRKHIKAQIRVYQKDKNGNQTGRYITPVGEDHYGHARNYAEIALPLAASQGKVIDIKSSIL